MRDAFGLKRTARLPSRRLLVKSAANFDLSLAQSRTFVFRKVDVVERREITITTYGATTLNPKTLLYEAEVTVDFGINDVAELGQYEWHIEAVFSSKRMDFPEVGFYTFSVTEHIEV